MAQAKKELTGNRVQGRPTTKDPLDKLVAIAIRVAQREGLLNEDPILQAGPADATGGSTKDRRSA